MTMRIATRPSPPQASVFRAALWMGGWLALMLTMAVAGRETASRLDVFQVMELRAFIGFALLQPLVMKAGGWRAMRSSRPLRHLSRNMVHYAAQYAWLLAVTLIPLAQVISIEFTMPIWAMVLGAIFLHERIGVRGFCALALGMSGIGALIGAELLRLGAAPLGTLLILAAAFCWGAGTVGIKAYEWRIGTIALSGWMFLIGGVPILAVWAATVAPPDLSRLTVPGVAALGYVIFVAMVFCFTAFLRIVRLLPAGVAAISTLVIPVVGVISSSVLLHEPIGYNEILALVLVLGALSLVLLKPRGGR